MLAEVTLEFLARQLDRVLARLGAIEEQMAVMTEMAIRHDAAMAGLTIEFRGLAAPELGARPASKLDPSTRPDD